MAEEFKGLGNEALKNVQGVRDTMREIDLSVRDLNRQLSSTGQQASVVSTEFSAINTSAKKFADLQDQASRSAKGTSDAIKEQQKQLNIVRTLNVRIDDLYREASKKTGEAAFNLKKQAENLSNARDNAKILADEYSTLAEDSAKLDKSTQFFGNLSKIASEIPILGKFSKPFQEASEAARKQT
jgi:predicted  nucleic acid-binding Zn-ribbon protein